MEANDKPPRKVTSEEIHYVRELSTPQAPDDKVLALPPMNESGTATDPDTLAQRLIANAQSSVANAKEDHSKAALIVRNRFISDLEEILAYRALLADPYERYTIGDMVAVFELEKSPEGNRNLLYKLSLSSRRMYYPGDDLTIKFEKRFDGKRKDASRMLIPAVFGGILTAILYTYGEHPPSNLWNLPVTTIYLAFSVLVRSTVLLAHDYLRASKEQITLKEATRRRWLTYGVKIDNTELTKETGIPAYTVSHAAEMITNCKKYFAERVASKVTALGLNATKYRDNL